MKISKKFHIFLCLFLIGVCLGFSAEKTDAAVKATSVSMSQTAYVLEIGRKVTLKATIYPSNVTSRKVRWKSSKPKVASVNGSGKVTAKKAGTTKITVTVKDGSKKKASINVKVVKKGKLKKIKKIRFTNTTKTVTVGKTLKLKTTISPSKATLKTLKYTSSNTSYATVSKKGVVKAKKAGKVKIKAEAQDGSKKKATITLKIKPVLVSRITLSSQLDMKTGESRQLTATVFPSNAANQALNWSSSDPGVVTVSASGKVTAKKYGTAVVKATAADGSNISASCNITVSDIPLTSATLTGSDLYLEKNGSDYTWTTYVGRTKHLTAGIAPSNATNQEIEWVSENPDIVQVTADGLHCTLVGKEEGTAKVRIQTTASGKTIELTSCTLEVKPAEESAVVDVAAIDKYASYSYVAFELKYRDTTGFQITQEGETPNNPISNLELQGAQTMLANAFQNAADGKDAFYRMLDLMQGDNELLDLFYQNSSISDLSQDGEQITFDISNGVTTRRITCTDFSCPEEETVTVTNLDTTKTVYDSKNVSFRIWSGSTGYYMSLAMTDEGGIVCKVSDADDLDNMGPFLILLKKDTEEGPVLYLQVHKITNGQICKKIQSFPDFRTMVITNLYHDLS